jgi:acetolactate synthase-1/2/3 large subunit
MDAMATSRIRYVSTRHEQVAVSIADAEGRVTGRPGVAFVHGGPGFLNSIVSIANAWKDGSPLFLVAGAVKRRMVGMDSWLEVPQSQMVGSLVKKAWRVERGSESGKVFAEAFSLAASPPAGPALVEVPEDVWSQEAGKDVVGLSTAPLPLATDEEVGMIASAIADAKRPLFVVGGGINNNRGAKALEALLSKVRAPVVSTGNGRGAVSENEALALGRIEFGGGNAVADGALGRADVVVCLGCGLSDVSTYGFNLTPRGEVYAVDLDPIWERKPVPYARHLRCDAGDLVERLADVSRPVSLSEDWERFIDEERKRWNTLLREAASRNKTGFVNPARFLQALDGRLPADAVIAAGQGLHILYAYSFVRVRTARGFLAATNMGSMGFVFPAALGAKMALPDREVFAVMGDGEFMMTLQDLETAVREKIGVKIIVVNDNSYRVLLMRQKIQRKGRIFGTAHTNPDMMKIAEAFGALAKVVDSNEKIDEAVEFATGRSEGPRIVELKVDPEDLPPLNLQGSLMF